MKKEKLVSIIINCFNGEKYLSQALESVIAQSYKNWEVIFWDNNSTDKSKKIFKSYRNKRFKYFYSLKHTNLSTARNLAIKKSKGYFLAFLDTDDWWEKNKLKEQIKKFEDEKVGLVYSNFNIYDERLKNKKIFLAHKQKLPEGFILNNLLKNYSIGLLTIVIKKNILKNFKKKFNQNFHLIGDFDLVIRISYKWKIKSVNRSLAYCRIHSKNEHIIRYNQYVTELRRWLKNIKNTKILNLDQIKNFNKKIIHLEAKQYLKKKNYYKFFKKLKKVEGFEKINLVFLLFYNFFKIKL